MCPQLIYRERENTQHDNQGFCRFQHVKFKIFLSPLCPLRPISHPNWQKNNTKDMKENQSKLIYSSVMLTMWIHNNVGWCQVLYVFLTSQTTNAFTHKVLLHFKLKLWSYLTKFHLQVFNANLRNSSRPIFIILIIDAYFSTTSLF